MSFFASNHYFNPRQIGSLVLWLDASDPSANGVLPSNGSSLATWKDKSTSGNNATQSTGANQPIFNTNQVNGLPAINFNGTTSFMNPGFNNFPSGSGARTIFCVTTISSLVQGYFFSHGVDLTSQRLSLGIFNGGVGGNYFLNFENDGFGETGQTSLSTSTPYLFYLNAQAGQATSAFATRIAGVNQTLTGTSTTLNTPATHSSIGAIQLALPAAVFWAGKISELLFFNTSLSGSNLTLINNYLKNKWGVTV